VAEWFVNRYEHTLDAKGRVILPAKFRKAFAQGGYLTQHDDGCLALWTPGAFRERIESVQNRAAESRDNRNLARVWASRTCELDMDPQGRITIPAHQRDFAGLAGEVIVNGAIDRVELWEPGRFHEVVEPSERLLSEGGDI
jgi:MraZ protein